MELATAEHNIQTTDPRPPQAQEVSHHEPISQQHHQIQPDGQHPLHPQDANQVPSQVDLAAMKDKIQRLMRMENLADITLAGYMIKLCRQRTKMSFRELHDEVSKCYDTLRRSDGSKYTGDLAKALKGCLTSSEIFKEVGENVWAIREKEAKMYEDKTTKKLKTLINKKKGRSGRKKGGGQDEEAESDDDMSGSEAGSDDSMELDKSMPAKKVKPTGGKYDKMYNMLEIYAKDIKANEVTAGLIQNPLERLGEHDTTEDALKKVGNERFLGILECFEYFSPLLQEYLQHNSKVENGEAAASKPGRKGKAATTKASLKADGENKFHKGKK